MRDHPRGPRRVYLTATVYNTLGHNDCPPKIWEGISEDAMKERFGALMVLMNGPRYFIMDEIGVGREHLGQDHRRRRHGAHRARLDRSRPVRSSHRPYRETTIDRDTAIASRPGARCSCSKRPDGSRYIMQAYAQIVDKTLTMTICPRLALKLKLPAGGANHHHDGRGRESSSPALKAKRP